MIDTRFFLLVVPTTIFNADFIKNRGNVSVRMAIMVHVIHILFLLYLPKTCVFPGFWQIFPDFVITKNSEN